MIHGIASGGVSDTRQDIFLPIQIARLQGRFKAGEDGQVILQWILVTTAIISVVWIVRHRTAPTFRHLNKEQRDSSSAKSPQFLIPKVTQTLLSELMNFCS